MRKIALIAFAIMALIGLTAMAGRTAPSMIQIVADSEVPL